MNRLRAYEGTFTSPFRERLLFGKLSLTPRPAHHSEITYNWRNETDIRGFGGQGASNSFETAENVRNRVDSVLGKYQIAGTPRAQRNLSLVPALSLEPDGRELRHRGRELRRG